MGVGDFVPDWAEDKVDGAKKLLGKGVERGTDIAADGLEKAGWDSGGDWLREKGKSGANLLGADVDELQLGQTDDPKKLIYGSAGKLRTTADHLRKFAAAFESVGRGLKGVDSGDLKGETAEAFRQKASLEPKKWFQAADACEKAGRALSTFADTVTWAQDAAQRAIDKWDQATSASEKARTAHNKKVAEYNAAVLALSDNVPSPPGEFQDPGEALAKEAQEILARAREDRNAAAQDARRAVESARRAAPPKPSYADQAKDGFKHHALDVHHFGLGFAKAGADGLNMVRGLNPMDPYNLTHPADYVTNLNSTAAGLVQMTNDPVGTGKAMLDDFQRDGAEASGRLLFDAVATRGAGRAARGLKEAQRAGRGTVRSDGPGAHSEQPRDRNSSGTDPVDLATGKMFLPQTDIELPGSLPLAFQRHVESGYRCGRWFGTSWASTVDQRLEVDAEGVIFITEDGRLLTYPHPVPGLPTLPTAGTARMPLERTADGGYTVTDPDTGQTRHFAPPSDDDGETGENGECRLDQITDRNGHQIDFVYDDQTGAPREITHTGGYRLRFTVTADRITELALVPAGDSAAPQPVMRYTYDPDGNLTGVTNSSALPLRFEYDDERRVISWTDTNDRRYDYVYDNQSRVIAEGGTEGHFQIRIDYDGHDDTTGHRVTTVTTPDGHATRHLYDARGHLMATTDPLGHTVRTTRDDHNHVLSHTDPLGHTTHFTYDDAGRLTRAVRPDGHETTVTYGQLGLPTQLRAPDGATWTYTYDERGNRTATTDPAGHATRYTYDSHGHLTSLTNALNETTTVHCNPAGLPVQITDPLGATTRYDRDAFGRPTTITDPTGAVTRLEWTVEGHLARRINPDGAEESWTYDGEGNRTRHVDANGGVTTYEYTHFDLLAAQTGPDGIRYEFGHDTALRLTQVTNPQGLTWDYTYDPAGRLTAETDFDDRTQTYAYDPAGHLTARTNPLGEVTTFDRDPQGNITRKQAPDQATTTYTYDPSGRLISATNPDAELHLQRDRLGRVKTEMVNGRVLTHTYDALGRRTRRTTPTGATTTYTYDAAGNRKSLTTSGHTLDFTHDAVGRETHRTIGPSGLTLTHLWEAAGRLTDQTLTTPTSPPLTHRTYTYRPDGYVTALTDHQTGTRHFDLDSAGRVTAVHATNWSETYAYDEAGNQTHATWPDTHAHPESTGPRTYTGTRINTAGRIRHEHDAAGRLTLRQKTRLSRKPDTWHYTWNAEDRLTHVTTPDGTHWRYRYDPLGRRIAKERLVGEGPVESVDFTWDGTVLVEQTTTTPKFPHPVTLTWDYDGYTPLAQTERLTNESTQAEIDSRFYAIVTDLVGTPTELVDEQGHIAWHTRTTLWGTTTWNRDADTYTPLRFPGQYHDPETGLHYNFYRYYEPTTARYTTPDPLGLTPAPNPAAYVRNPHAWTDPHGLAPGSCRPIAGDTLGDTSKLRGWIPTQVPSETLHVIDDLKRFGHDATGWGPQFQGPKLYEPFENSGKNGGHQLPAHTSNGDPITYREYGTAQSPDNPSPGGERIVTGSDGSIYYSPTHYQTYIVVEGPRW